MRQKLETNRVKTKGKVNYPQLFEFNRDREGYEGAYRDFDGAYVCRQELTKEEYSKLTSNHSLKKPANKKLLEGIIEIKHERKHFDPKDENDGGPPEVVDENDQPWDPEVQGLIGNGSVCEVTSKINPFYRKNGEICSRTVMEKVKVLEAHIYDPETGETTLVPGIAPATELTQEEPF